MSKQQILINGLKLFRNGIKKGSWDDVCEGYYVITGERLSPPEPPRDEDDFDLDEIRQALFEEPQKPTTEGKTVPQLKKMLVEEFGYRDSQVAKLKKQELVDLVNKTTYVSPESDVEEVVEPTIKKVGRMQVISSGKDPEEIQRNRELRKKNPVHRGEKRPTEYESTFGKYDIADEEVEKRGFRMRDYPPKR